MSIRTVMYANVEIWVWVLVAIVAALAIACGLLYWSRSKVGKERDGLATDLSYTRAELRRLRMQWSQSRKPALTIVAPAFRDAPADPEEFTRTQIRSVR